MIKYDTVSQFGPFSYRTTYFQGFLSFFFPKKNRKNGKNFEALKKITEGKTSGRLSIPIYGEKKKGKSGRKKRKSEKKKKFGKKRKFKPKRCFDKNGP